MYDVTALKENKIQRKSRHWLDLNIQNILDPGKRRSSMDRSVGPQFEPRQGTINIYVLLSTSVWERRSFGYLFCFIGSRLWSFGVKYPVVYRLIYANLAILATC